MAHIQDQIDEISNLLLEYSSGNYQYKGRISDSANSLDMIISGINMLGEELLATNVSRDFFSSIFNTVTDIVFVVDPKGKILDSNQAVQRVLGRPKDAVNGSNVSTILDNGRKILFQKVINSLKVSEPSVFEYEIFSHSKQAIAGLFTCSHITHQGKTGYLMSIRDITLQKLNQQLLLKAIIEAQQNEQRRVAADLHDSIGQELSMAKLMISNLDAYQIKDAGLLKLIKVCEEILDGSVSHLRDICFNLMPGVLEKGGVALAIQDLLNRLNCQDKIKATMKIQGKFPRLPQNIEIVLFRITQEFINNMIKHSTATQLRVSLSSTREVVLEMLENGQGFDLSRLDKPGNNRGYANIKSSIHAYGGTMKLESTENGTKLRVIFPKAKPNGKIQA